LNKPIYTTIENYQFTEGQIKSIGPIKICIQRMLRITPYLEWRGGVFYQVFYHQLTNCYKNDKFVKAITDQKGVNVIRVIRRLNPHIGPYIDPHI